MARTPLARTPCRIIKRSLRPCALFAIALAFSACALTRLTEEAEPAPTANPAARQPTAMAKEIETIPPEPPLPQEVSPLATRSERRKAYRVRGKAYYPLVTAEGYEERGIACWYGPSFQGHKTASGETFDMYAISAAHKILPMNTTVEVMNLENGKSISLRINDRGPFVAGRVLDLSYGAAKALAMADKGLARVMIRTCGAVEGQKKDDIFGRFFIHIGSFEQKADAACLLADMKAARYKPGLLNVVRAQRDGAILWRVELGPYTSMVLAQKAHAKVIEEYPSAFVVAK